MAVEPARAEPSHACAAVADQRLGEAIGLGEVGEQRLAVGQLPELGVVREASAESADRCHGLAVISLEQRPDRPRERLLPLDARPERGGVRGRDGVEEREEGPVLARVELHRRRGEEQEPPGARGDRLDGGERPLAAQVVGLVDDDQVPSRGGDSRTSSGERESSSRLVTTRGKRSQGETSGSSRRLRARRSPSISVKSCWNLWNSSASHWTVRWLGATTSTRAARPERRSAEKIIPPRWSSPAPPRRRARSGAGAPRGLAAPRRSGAA